MRVWLQKQKKKEEAKAAAQAATPAAETTPAATEAPSEVEGADKPVDSVEEATAPADASAEPASTATEVVDGEPRGVSASVHPNEVGLHPTFFPTHARMRQYCQSTKAGTGRTEWLKSINTIDLARAGGCGIHISPCALADTKAGICCT